MSLATEPLITVEGGIGFFALLPDILSYDWTTQSRFPNGHTLMDDVSDWT